MATNHGNKCRDETSYWSPWMNMPRPHDRLNAHNTSVQQPIAEPSASPAIQRWVQESPGEAPWNGVQLFRLPTLSHPAISSADPTPSTDKTMATVGGHGRANL